MTIRKIHRYLRSSGWSFEIIVVCDGCADGTEFLVRRLAAKRAGRYRRSFPTPPTGARDLR